ncbi:MAG: nucleotidyltransferase domain-containing protein [Anaerolineae bacterium]|nr:nucleotidyltransferase domain-containing protein [Anaerolineae bacterium]
MEEYGEYKRHWKRRAERERRERKALAAEARAEARKLGELLVQEFGATRVYLFGSLVRDGAFHGRSDIDLAVEGIAPAQFFKAGAALARACGYRYRVELVELETVGQGMRNLILTEGVVLYDRTGNPPAH